MAFPGSPAHREVYQDYYWDNTYSVWRQYVETPNVTHITTTTTINSDSSLIYVDPTGGAVDLTLPGEPFIGKKQRVVVKHLSSGEVTYGDCEDGSNAPRINSETPVKDGNATWARDASQYHGGSYSYKITDTTGAGTNVYIHDAGADLHGLTASQTYTFSAWYYVPTASGLDISEAVIMVYDVTNGAAIGEDVGVESLDKWYKMNATFTIPSTCTEIKLYFQITSAASVNEYFFVDDVKLYRHYPVTIKAPTNKDLANIHSIELNSDEDYAEIIWNGDNFSLTEYYDHGQNTSGTWKRGMGGTVTISPSDASGGNNGDIWFKIP